MNGRILPLPADTVAFLRALALSCLLHAAAAGLAALGGAQPPTTAVATRPGLSARLMPPQPKRPAPSDDAPIPPSAPPAPAAPPPPDAISGLGLLPLPSETFYAAQRLSPRPRPLANVELDNRGTLGQGISGKLVVALYIDAIGRVVNVEIEHSDLPAAIAADAVAAFKRTRFQPGELDGRPVGSLLRVEIDYEDDGRPSED